MRALHERALYPFRHVFPTAIDSCPWMIKGVDMVWFEPLSTSIALVILDDHSKNVFKSVL